MDTYCSPETLMEDGESLPGFFSVLEQGQQEHRERFSQMAGLCGAGGNEYSLGAGR